MLQCLIEEGKQRRQKRKRGLPHPAQTAAVHHQGVVRGHHRHHLLVAAHQAVLVLQDHQVQALVGRLAVVIARAERETGQEKSLGENLQRERKGVPPHDLPRYTLVN